jgi:hypothetical protein
VRRGGLARASWAGLVGSQEKIQIEIDFQISIGFGFWQDFENSYKEIRSNMNMGFFPKFF